MYLLSSVDVSICGASPCRGVPPIAFCFLFTANFFYTNECNICSNVLR